MEFHTYARRIFVIVKEVSSPRNIIGPVLRELRKERGLTQGQLVAKLNVQGWDVSRDIIARIEGQTRWVADSEIPKLARGLGIDGPELLRRAIAREKSKGPGR